MDNTNSQSPNPFKEEGFKLSSLTHKCCCVAVKITENDVVVRDTKNPNGPTLSFNHDEWAAFIGGVKMGEFDVKVSA
ncbi:MAG: DUF397 domain-containing protein [Candidatus Paceibacteria bacterium]